MATAYTPHPCTTVGQHRCQGDTCGGTYSAERYAGTCDPDGCDFNSYRQGDREFYGPGKTVELLQRGYYWKNMRDSVMQYIRNCHICQRSRTSRHDRVAHVLPVVATLQELECLGAAWVARCRGVVMLLDEAQS